MLNVVSVLLRGGDPEGGSRALRSMQRQGFDVESRFDWDGNALCAWGHPTQRGVENCEIRVADGVACCVGPIWYQGCFGRAALKLLIAAFTGARCLDERALRGNFALFVRTVDHCVLMNDALGLVRLYASPDGRFFSSSWLATCAYAGSVAVDDAAAVQYVLLGASHSDATVARGISTVPLGQVVDLVRQCLRERFPTATWCTGVAPPSFDAAVDDAVDMLRTTFAEIASAFPGKVRTALSGGFDSRLILAALLAAGMRPELFVYGALGSEDVPVAQAVARYADIPLSVVDKDALNGRLDPPDLDQLVQCALFFDGLPNDGIHDPGADRSTRLEQMAGGHLAPNGGGGEIFRNYFHLPDRRFQPRDLVRAFYRGFDASVFRRRRGLREYEAALARAIGQTLGVEGAGGRCWLAREQVELLYPLFRCHHWMAVNNSVASRHGFYSTPLVDWNTVRLGCRLSLAWKNAGRFESRLIAALDGGIARQPSAYGFSFWDGPNTRARFNEWSICMRPVFARPFISMAHRRVRGQSVDAGMVARCRRLLPGEWRMDPLLDLQRLPDNQAFARALAVEVVWRELVG